MTLPIREQQRLFKNYGTWAIITGATSGIGLELATQLAAQFQDEQQILVRTTFHQPIEFITLLPPF